MTTVTLTFCAAVAGHMLGGMRSATANITAAALTVVARVHLAQPVSNEWERLTLEVLDVPCGAKLPPGRLEVFQFLDHGAHYTSGRVAVFPLSRARDAAHTSAQLDPLAYVVDQSDRETAWLTPKTWKDTARLLAALCRATHAQRVNELVALLGSPVPALSGGAALELLLWEDWAGLSPVSALHLKTLMGDASQPLALRVTAVTVAGRTRAPELEAHSALTLGPQHPGELVAASVRALKHRPDLLTPMLPTLLLGPPGLGRLAAAHAAGHFGVEAAVPGLRQLAYGPEAAAAATACAALARIPGQAARGALEELAAELPERERKNCGSLLTAPLPK